MLHLLVGGSRADIIYKELLPRGGGSGWVPQPGWVGQKFGTPPPLIILAWVGGFAVQDSPFIYIYGLGGWVYTLGS